MSIERERQRDRGRETLMRNNAGAILGFTVAHVHINHFISSRGLENADIMDPFGQVFQAAPFLISTIWHHEPRHQSMIIKVNVGNPVINRPFGYGYGWFIIGFTTRVKQKRSR